MFLYRIPRRDRTPSTGASLTRRKNIHSSQAPIETLLIQLEYKQLKLQVFHVSLKHVQLNLKNVHVYLKIFNFV